MLSQGQLNFYNEHGWIVFEKFASKATIAKIKKELANVHEDLAKAPHPSPRVGVAWENKLPPGSPKKILQLMGSEVVSPTLNEVVTSPEMLDMLEQLIGPDITLYHSKLLMKAPHVGDSFFPWHQDYGYWTHHEKEPTQMNCALAIDPQTIENGCLHYVSGSHKQGFREHMHSNNGGFDWGLGTDIKQFPGTPVEYDAGDICFFGALVIHGSEPNRTNESATFNTAAYDKSSNHRDDRKSQNIVLRRPSEKRVPSPAMN